MKCINCGTEYEGNFCPVCGVQSNSAGNAVIKNQKVKKKIYKKWWFWVIAVILLLFLGSFFDSGNNDSIEPNENTNEIISEVTNYSGSINKDEKTEKNEITETDKVTIKDICEFKLDYKKITADVLPPKQDSWYSHYEAEKGKMYVDICIAYKNLSDRAVDADEVGGLSLTYADKYQYSGFSIIEEENRSDFTYSKITSIDPLNTEYIHYLVEIPKEAAESTESLVATLFIESNSYTIKIR